MQFRMIFLAYIIYFLYIACRSVISPALTKLTTMTVVALLDWMSAVTPTPVNTPLKRLRVMAPRITQKLHKVPYFFCGTSFF